MRIIIAPDKFKGSLTSMQVCLAVQKGILDKIPDAEICILPMADGGDGFATVMKHYLKTESRILSSINAADEPISSSYEWNEKEKIAIIEMANCSGLAMLNPGLRNPMLTSTFGTGIQLKDAIANGAKKIVLGLGGSATNDAGTGILSALGFTFLDERKRVVKTCGGQLIYIKEIVTPFQIPNVKIEIACDVNNPLFGPNGAAYIFAAQKGADIAQIELLDDGLRHFAKCVEKATGKDISSVPGSGAAGGVAAGIMAYFDTTIQKGIELFFEASNLHSFLPGTDVIITGEGKIDEQSFNGKVVGAIASLSAVNNIPCIALCGKLDLNPAKIKQMGLAYAFELTHLPISSNERMKRAAEFAELKGNELAELLYNIL